MESDDTRIRASLTEDHEALLQLLLEEEGLKPEHEISPREASKDAPLSFQQQSLWLFDQLIPDNPAYNISITLRLQGWLNLDILEQSLHEIVHRHESLRTTFVTRAEQTVQHIIPAMRYPFSVVDLAPLSAQERETLVLHLAKEEILRPFTLTCGPFLRSVVIRLGEQEHALILTLHHIIADAWSLEILFNELTTLYDGYMKGEIPSLPVLPIQYADFALWQQEHLQGARLEELLAYWRQQLAGAPAISGPAPDLPRPTIQTFQGARYPIALPHTLSVGLKSLSLRANCTLFITLLAALQILLYRYSGQKDLIVGTPSANRPRTETEYLIGYFVNMLPIRTILSERMSFLELLEQVREATLGAYAHQDLPFQLMVEALQPERDLGHMPIFQIVLMLQNAIFVPKWECQDLSIHPFIEGDNSNTTTKYDLTMSLRDTEEGLQGEIEYNIDIFEKITIEHLCQHLQVLLQSIVANPYQRLDDLPLLSEGERQRILMAWNQTKSAYPQQLGVHQIFEQWVQQGPDAIAVVFEEQYLTYQALNQRANQLAHLLHKQGVGPEVCVGVCLPHSLELVVGLLAILKAGGAYVPLDPAYPQERLAFMIEDMRLPVVVTLQQWSPLFLSCVTSVFCLDRDGEHIARESHENLACYIQGEQLAYVNYTSGSTGVPKGVGLPHSGVVRLVCTPGYLQLTPSDRVTQTSNTSFDACTIEIWGALLNGACLVEIQQDMVLAPRSFVEQLRRDQVTTVFVTTALLNFFAREMPDAFKGLPHIMFGGEAADPNWIAVILQEGAPQKLLHLYGPTENTTVTLWCQMQAIDQGRKTVPIGCPVAGDRVYVLDQRGHPVPMGVAGELYAGGAGLARGYLRRPDLTAERFVPDPFSGERGARLYRTGDVVRARSDGNLEFVGRTDQQVKVRGHRIELGEIEWTLTQHPDVQACVVTSREDTPGEKFLIAYLVGKGALPLSVTELRRFLVEKLPEYMIPSVYIWLDTFPLTPNGKVDYQALPIPDGALTQPQRNYLAPRDSLELRLSQMWEHILGIQPVGVTDNFFALGGHSFLAIRLMDQLQRDFGLQLPVSLLFQKGTIEHLASVLRQQEHISLRSALVPIQPHGTGRPFFCIHPVSGEVFVYHPLAQHLGVNQPLYGLQDTGMHETVVPYLSLENMADTYIQALRTVQPEGPYFLGGWSFGGILAFEMAQQLQRQGGKVALLAIFDSVAPIPASKRVEMDDTSMLAILVLELTRTLAGATFQEIYNSLLPLELDEQLRCALNLMQRAGRELPLNGKQWLSQLLQLFQMRTRAVQNYTAQSYSGPLALFRASEPDDSVHPSFQQKYMQDLGWGELATTPPEIHIIPGYHDTMLIEPNVGKLAQRLRLCLEKL